MTQTIQHTKPFPYVSSDEVAGSEALIRTLINEGVDVVFGSKRKIRVKERETLAEDALDMLGIIVDDLFKSILIFF